MNEISKAMCELLCEEEKDILKKGELTKEDLDNLHKIVSTVKNYKTIETMEGEGKGYSQHYPHLSMERGGSYRGEGSYEGSYDDMSGRRGRDARTGRYVSREGSYGEGSYGEGSYGDNYRFKSMIENMKNEAKNPKEKEALEMALAMMK